MSDSFLTRIINTITWYFTYVLWFLKHCYHPPVDMFRTWKYGFDWESTLQSLYSDAFNHSNFDPEIDFATVVGCSTGVGFEVAAGLAACNLNVLAGIRGDAARVESVVEDLKKRSKAIRKKRFGTDAGFEPKIQGLLVDVSDFNSCRKFVKNVEALLGKDGSSSSSSSRASSKPRASSAKRGRSTSTKGGRGRSASKPATASESNKNNNNQKLLRVALMNAAVLMTHFEATPQGFETQSATNALGHMIIAEHLVKLGCLSATVADPAQRRKKNAHSDRDSRLIFVSSSGARFGDPLRGTFSNINHHSESKYGRLHPTQHCQFKMYGDSKALIACYAKLLQRRIFDIMHNRSNLKTQNDISVRVLHPGCIASAIVRDSGMPGGKTLAKLQGTVGIALGMMITEESASAYPLRLCLGAAGRFKGETIEKEDSELFSYIFMFEPEMMKHYLSDENVLDEVREAVQHNLAPYLPGRRSLIA